MSEPRVEAFESDTLPVKLMFILFLVFGTVSSTVILLGWTTGLSDFLSNRFTLPEIFSNFQPRFNAEEISDYRKVAENEILVLLCDFRTTSIAVVDKRTRFIWSDAKTDEEAFLQLNDTWKAIAKSSLIIEYFDDKGISGVIGSADAKAEKNWEILKNGIMFKVKFSELGIDISFTVELVADKLIFKIAQSGISDGTKYSLASVMFAPFFGSVPEDSVPGYIFVPDGPGALIRFSKPAHYLNWFEKRIYGKDYGIDNLASVNDLRSKRPNDFLRDEPNALLPVFGIVHGAKRNAIFGVVTEGAEYSSIIAYPSGLLTKYNWATAKFIYRQKYLQPTSRSGAGIQVAQKERNKFNAQLVIHFLSGDDADYVGMAKTFRTEYAKALFKNSSKRLVKEKHEPPLLLTFVASDIEKRVVGTGTLSISTFEQIKTMIESLQLPARNLKVLIEGWKTGGMNGGKVSAKSVERRIGGLRCLVELVNWSKSREISLFLVENVTKVSEKQVNLKREVGTNLSQSVIYEERDNKDLWLYRSYYTNILMASKYLEEVVQHVSKYGVSGLAVREYASRLYGDLKMGREIYRNDALKLVEKTLATISGCVRELYLFTPNMYAFKYATGVVAVPMNSSQYLFETDTVPFLQIVLSGTIDYFTPYMNNGFFSRADILKAIDYGAYPSFILTYLDNYKLKRTALWDYPSTKFDDWKDRIVKVYGEISKALGPVRGARIENRTVLAPGVVAVSYDNGKTIVVNYTPKPYSHGGLKVNAESWKILDSMEVLRVLEVVKR